MLLRLLRFLRDVISEFRKNQGLLLAGAVAYYTLLSLVPLFAVLLVGLAHFVEPARLLETLTTNLEMLLPGQARAITEQVAHFLAHREVIGYLGGAVVLFFSSMAFVVLENAMSVIFFHRVAIRRRHFLVSAIIPYLFIMSLAAGFLAVTFISGALEVVGRSPVHLLGRTVSLASLPAALLHVLGALGLVLLLTALYLVMPVGRIAFRHALLGAATATLLWEGVRHLLVWYFTRLSMVNVIYGSLATTVVVLLTLEVAAGIVLFGAQVIATFERGRRPPPEVPPPQPDELTTDG